MKSKSTNAVEPGRNPFRLGKMILGIVLLGAILACIGILRHRAPKPPAMDSANQSALSAAQHLGTRAPAQHLKTNRTGAVVAARTDRPLTSSRSESPAAAQGAGSPVARQLLAGLTQFNPGGGVSQQKADELKRSLKELTAQGTAAVPAIREYLDRLQDIDFDAIGAGKMVGYSSLRMGLLDALGQIGGPEALAAFHQTLQTTADPAEIAMVARNLDALAPGEYRQEALSAAREALAQAASGQLSGRDVGPLFSVLQTYGDATVVADLEKVLPQWGFYATMALAGLPNGAGVPALIRSAQDPELNSAGRENFRFQILAQIAPQYPEAAAALIDQARLNQVPDWAWRKIALGLAGDQYQLNNPLLNASPPSGAQPGLKTYHIENGNQNFYSTPYLDGPSAAPIDQRVALINQLLASTSNPAAKQALERALAMVSANSANIKP